MGGSHLFFSLYLHNFFHIFEKNLKKSEFDHSDCIHNIFLYCEPHYMGTVNQYREWNFHIPGTHEIVLQWDFVNVFSLKLENLDCKHVSQPSCLLIMGTTTYLPFFLRKTEVQYFSPYYAHRACNQSDRWHIFHFF